MITSKDIAEYQAALSAEKLIKAEVKGPSIEYKVSSDAELYDNEKRANVYGFDKARVKRIKDKMESYIEGIQDPVLQTAMTRKLTTGCSDWEAVRFAVDRKAPVHRGEQNFTRRYEYEVSNRMKQIEINTQKEQINALKERLERI